MVTLSDSSNRFPWLFAGVLLTVLAVVYWPVVHGDFIWIDRTDFVQHAWLREGDAWKHYIWRGFNNWTQYFRPLVVGLFTLQLRLFHDSPGPMHAVTLVMHLGNVLMVGLLAFRCCGAAPRAARWLGLAAMALYGFHPMLIETVAWIGCQFEQVTNLLTLACLLASVGIRGTWLRAATITVLFFLAACAKESAIVIPPLVLLFDWLLHSDRTTQSFWPAVRKTVLRNLPTYAGMVLAGIVYLLLRRWALGALINIGSMSQHQPLLEHVQEVAYLYVHYWTMLIWPVHMSVIHPVDAVRFQALSVANVATDIAALAIFCTGVWLAWRRASVVGCLVLAVTVSLLPVLHILSINFDSSLYHERYAMTALAMACVLVMRMRPLPLKRVMQTRRAGILAAGVLTGWMLLAVLNIRATLPLWANDLGLWSWAANEYPRSTTAANNLLNAYITSNAYREADALLDRIRREHLHCPRCLLGEAVIALNKNDPDRAGRVLQEVRAYPELGLDRTLFQSYLAVTGQMLVDKHKFHDAEGVLREAIRLDPMAPEQRIALASALAGQGEIAQAQQAGLAGIALLPPSQQARHKRMLESAIAGYAKQKGAYAPAAQGTHKAGVGQD